MGKLLDQFAVIFLLTIIYNADNVRSSATVMKDIAKGFEKATDDCIKELKLPDDAINELYNFWNDKFDLTRRDVGCAIICIAGKHDLHTEDGKFHHENGAQLAKKHGADEETAKKLVEMVHTCEQTHAAVDDHCMRALETAKCFRVASKALNWSPDFQELIDDIMA